MHRAFKVVAAVFTIVLLVVPASALTTCWAKAQMGQCHSGCGEISQRTESRVKAPCCCGDNTSLGNDSSSQLPVMTNATDAPVVTSSVTMATTAFPIWAAATLLLPLQHHAPQAVLCTFLI